MWTKNQHKTMKKRLRTNTNVNIHSNRHISNDLEIKHTRVNNQTFIQANNSQNNFPHNNHENTPNICRNQAKRNSKNPRPSSIIPPDDREIEAITNHQNINKILSFTFKWKGFKETTTGRIELALHYRPQLGKYLDELKVSNHKRYNFLINTYTETLGIMN